MALIGVISVLLVLMINKSQQHRRNNVDQFSENQKEMVKTLNEMMDSASNMVDRLINSRNSAVNVLDEEWIEKASIRLFCNSKFAFQMDENAKKNLQNFCEKLKNNGEEFNENINEMVEVDNNNNTDELLNNKNKMLAKIQKNLPLTDENIKHFSKIIELAMNGFVQFNEIIKAIFPATKFPIFQPQKCIIKNSSKRRRRKRTLRKGFHYLSNRISNARDREQCDKHKRKAIRASIISPLSFFGSYAMLNNSLGEKISRTTYYALLVYIICAYAFIFLYYFYKMIKHCFIEQQQHVD